MTLLQWPNLNLNFWNSLWSRVFWTHDQMTFTQYTNIPPIPLNPTHFFPKYEIWSKVDFWCRVPLWMGLNWTVMLSTTGNGRWPGIYYLSRGREEGQPAKSQTFPLVAENLHKVAVVARRYKAKTSNLGTTHTERPTDLTNSKYQQQQHKYTTQVWGLPELKLVFHFSSFEDCPSRYYSNINIRIIRICPNLFSNYSVLKWNDLSQQEIQVSSSRWSFVTSCTPFLPSSCISSGFLPKFKGLQPNFTNTLNKFYTNSEPSFKFNSISIIRIKSKFCPRSLTKDLSARKCKN